MCCVKKEDGIGLDRIGKEKEEKGREGRGKGKERKLLGKKDMQTNNTREI